MESSSFTVLAEKYINNTSRNIFLTGKAGTGKTTFLRKIKESTYKNTVVAAPTGIAAINAGGVTLHSLFQLPFGSFIPEESPFDTSDLNQQYTTPKSLVRKLQLHASKRKLLNEIELLIIDEVSMLRADLLDAIDTVLRYVRRKKNQAFGGVQVLFIGDLMQLPPVVKEQEWDRLKNYYKSPFFFDARVIDNNPMVYVELEKVFRQSDDEFLSLLNRLRQNMIGEEDLELLNQYAQFDYMPESDEGYIYITTHNWKADKKNNYELARIEAEPVSYQASIEGEFDERNYPHGAQLVLKEGAQVMFIKNDPTGEQRFFNGKIGTVTYLDETEIMVKCTDGEIVDVQKYSWENKKFSLDKDTNEIEENTVGIFSQFPLRLAWAITVHKSQGLTFERAILDLSDSFTAGQVYVALSRLTSLKGLMLASAIPATQFETDQNLVKFASTKKEVDDLEKEFDHAVKDYHKDYVRKVFDFDRLSTVIYFINKDTSESGRQSPRYKWTDQTRALVEEIGELRSIGNKFVRQCEVIIFTSNEKYLPELIERVDKAHGYFEPRIRDIEKQVAGIQGEIKSNKKLKSFTKDLDGLKDELFHVRKYLLKLIKVLKAAEQGAVPEKDKMIDESLVEERKKTKQKSSRKHTKEITYDLYLQGKSIEEIAEHRGLTEGTISNHLSDYVKSGNLSVGDFCDLEKVDNILTVAEKKDTNKLTDIMQHLGDEYTYADIRFALAHAESLKTKQEK